MCFGGAAGPVKPYREWVAPAKDREKVPAWMTAQVIAQRQRRGLEGQKKRKKPSGEDELDLAGSLLGGE